MKTDDKITLGVILALLILCICMIFITSNIQDKLTIAELKLSDTSHYFNTLIDKQGNEYAEQEQVIATQKQAIKSGLIEKQELKDKNIKLLQSLVKITQAVEIIGKKANFINDPEIIYITDTIKIDTQAFLRVPISFKYSDKYLLMQGRVLTTGVIHDSIKIQNKGTLMLGYKKTGFMKRSPVVSYESSNPYFVTKSMSNVVIEEKRRFYEKGWFWGCVGVAGGFYLGSR